MKPVQKLFDFRLADKGLDETNHRVSCIVTTGSIDRDREVVLPSSIAKRLAIYMANPKHLWNHRVKGDPKDCLGRCLSLTEVPDGWEATFEYDVDINENAALVFAQIQRGSQRTYSISFLPVRWVTRMSPAADIEALPPEVKGWLLTGQCDTVYTEVEIIEISGVHVPSNRDATKELEEENITVKVAEKAEPATEVVEKAVDKTISAPVSKLHPGVADVCSRLRTAASSMEGWTWEEYQNEEIPNAPRLEAVLVILESIAAQVKAMLPAATAQAPEVVTQPVMMSAPEGADKSTEDPTDEPASAEDPPIAEPAAEPETSTSGEKSFDPGAYAMEFLGALV